MSHTPSSTPEWKHKVSATVGRAGQSAVLLAGLSTLLRLGANFLLLPFLLKFLTTAELAVWWVFVALGSMANLADFGFGQAITRVYNYLWAGADDFDAEGLRPATGAGPNLPKIREFNLATRTLYARLSFAALFVLAFGGSLFLAKSGKADVHDPHFWAIWASYALAIVYTFGTSHWTLACQGINKVREMQYAGLVGSVFFLVIAASMLFIGLGLWSLVIAFSVRAVINRQICAKAYYTSVPSPAPGSSPNPSPSPATTPLSPHMLRKLWPNAWKLGLLSIAVYMINSGPVLVCDYFLDAKTTASFGLTAQLAMVLSAFSGLWLTVKWPQITILRTQGQLEQMSIEFARRLAFTLATYAMLAVLLVLVGDRLLEWKGSNARLLPFAPLVVYLLFYWQCLIFGSFGTLTFTENVVPFYRLGFATGVGTLVLSILMTPRFGVWGLVLPPLIVAQLGNSWLPILRGFRGQPLSVLQFVRAALLGHK